MNIRHRSMIRNLLEQLQPFEEQATGEDVHPERCFSLAGFLRRCLEDPTFLEAFEYRWSRLPSPGEAHEGWEPGQALRVFTPEEEHFLTSEARGYLLKLCATGTLTSAQLETVIDHAFECWAEEVNLEMARLLAAVVLLHEAFGAAGSDEADAAPPSMGIH